MTCMTERRCAFEIIQTKIEAACFQSACIGISVWTCVYECVCDIYHSYFTSGKNMKYESKKNEKKINGTSLSYGCKGSTFDTYQMKRSHHGHHHNHSIFILFLYTIFDFSMVFLSINWIGVYMCLCVAGEDDR